MHWSYKLLDLNFREGIISLEIAFFQWLILGYLEIILPRRSGWKYEIKQQWEFKYCSEGLFV